MKYTRLRVKAHRLNYWFLPHDNVGYLFIRLYIAAMAVRILFYDDNESLRQSMETLLNEEPDMEFIAGISNAETVETDIAQLHPDVMVMDIDMPLVNGVEAVRRIRKVKPDLPIIMLTVFDDNENIFNAICAGASGIYSKEICFR